MNNNPSIMASPLLQYPHDVPSLHDIALMTFPTAKFGGWIRKGDDLSNDHITMATKLAEELHLVASHP
jgi:hypothetical protein